MHTNCIQVTDVVFSLKKGNTSSETDATEMEFQTPFSTRFWLLEWEYLNTKFYLNIRNF